MTSQTTVSPRSAQIAYILGMTFFCYAFVQRVAPSIMTTELMRDFAVGGAALGSLSAFYFWAYAGIQLPVGMLTDKFGPRKLMGVTAGICAIAGLGFAMSESLIVASFWRALIGATVAFGFVGTLAIVGYWFNPKNHAALAGGVQGVGMLGAVFAQSALRPVVETFGWRHTMGALALLALLLSVLIMTFIPRRDAKQRQANLTSSARKVGVLQGLKSVMANRQSWLCAVIGFGMASTMLSFSGLWAVPWLHTVHGYTITEAAGIAAMLFFGWAVFSPIVGWLSDYFGRRNRIMFCGAAIYTLSYATILFYTPENTQLLLALMFITGASGSTMTVCFIAAKELNHPQFGSTAIGLMNMFVVGSGAVMQPLIGWLLDMNWDGVLVDGARIYNADTYTFALASLIAVNIAAWVGTLLLRETHCQQVG